nr:hypothetical protein [Candidatus Gastranaerophilales bacterium]
TVTGDVTNTTNSVISSAISVNEGASLSTSADAIGHDVVSSGTVDLTGGTLSQTIAGGNTSVSGDVAVDDAAGYIDGAVAVTTGANLKTNADNVNGAISAAGQVELTGGELTQNVTGTGTTKIAGDVINSANVQTLTEVASGSLDNTNGQLASVVVTDGSLKSDADKISGTVTNNGTYEVTGGTISNDISGNGNVNITGDTTVDTAVSATGTVNVAEGATLSLGANSTDMFGSASQIELNDGSVLNLNNGNATPTTVNNINVAADSQASVEMAWGDTVNSASGSVDGNLSITKLDLTNTDGSSVSYAFSNLGTDIAFADDIEIVGTSESSNFVRYDSTTGQMNSKTNSLQTAVDDTNAGEKSIYIMNGSESGGNDTLVGDLTVRGNGGAITGGGIVVGDGITAGADLILEDVSINNVNAAQDGALFVNGGNTLEIKAENSDVTMGNTSGSQNAIYMQSDANGTADVTISANTSRTVDITDDIRSNNAGNVLTLSGAGDIHLRGILDPLTVNMSAANVYRYNQDQNIIWNLNGGILHYASDSYLSGLGNAMNFNGGSLDLMNGAATNINLTALNVNANSNIFVDVNAASQTMDTLTAPAMTAAANLNVAGMNIFGAPVATEFETLFVDGATLGNGALIGKVTSSVTNVDTGVYKYNVNYVDDGTTGKFKYSVVTTPKAYDSYSPAIFASSAAMQGSYLSQLNNYDTAFSNIDQTMLLTQDQRKALRYGNKYAANDETNPQVYSPLYLQNENKGIWFRPYASFEQVQLNNGPDVNNVMYGSLVGGDTEIFSIGDSGWEGQVSVYAGYNGSHQTYEGIGIYQNGGLVGATGVLFRGNFFTALTANVGASAANIKTNFGSNDMTMLTTGVASKTGYNWELFDGKLILQPSWTMSYTLINPFNNYTMGNGVRIENSAVNALQLAPGLKIIGNLPKGWQPYLGVNMRWNIMDDTKVKAGYVGVPETSVKPYIEYGLGVQKMIGDRFTGFGQAMFRGGGRNGVAFTFGFRWALGELNDKHQKKSENMTKYSDKLSDNQTQNINVIQTSEGQKLSRKLNKISR